jgi:hypothetical protein
MTVREETLDLKIPSSLHWKSSWILIYFQTKELEQCIAVILVNRYALLVQVKNNFFHKTTEGL